MLRSMTERFFTIQATSIVLSVSKKQRSKYSCKSKKRISALYCDQIKHHGVERVQILSPPYRTDGSTSVDKLNAYIRELVNPIKDDSPDLKISSKYFRIGDKVMQMQNSEKASNGDIGFIRKIGRNKNNEPEITIEFSDSRTVEYTYTEMAHLELAYATTIHKAMGSEYDVVILPVLRSHAIMLNRNLVYTAITRAKKKVIMVGQKGMLIMAIHRNETGKRNTMLAERITRYQWAQEYFMNLDVKEDKTDEDKEFVPKPYHSSTTSRAKKKDVKKEETPKKDSPKKA